MKYFKHKKERKIKLHLQLKPGVLKTPGLCLSLSNKGAKVIIFNSILQVD